MLRGFRKCRATLGHAVIKRKLPSGSDLRGPAPAFSRWGTRAATLYTDTYAERYRAHDDTLEATQSIAQLGEWLHGVCRRFNAPIDALDLGCGTGRYFRNLAGVRRLVGIDASRAMLERARQPAGAIAMVPGWLTLIEGDLLKHDFGPCEFDLVYSIGVLAEHSPFDESVSMRVDRWLKPGGRFAFTTVHPRSFSVPRTFKRRAGEWLMPVATGSLRRTLRARLMSDGIYADEERVREVLGAAGLVVESIESFESDVHFHVLAVALKPVH
jgi:SAM-dependent methyltransferase